MKTRFSVFADFALAVLSGLLLTAAFPKAGLSWLAWVALVPLIVRLGQVSAGRSFRLGFLAGLAHYLTLCYWVVPTMQTYGGLPVYLSVPVLFLFSAYLAAYIGVFCLSLRCLCREPWELLWLAPFSWTALEYVRGFFLTGFPWELLGYAHYRTLHLIQISDIFGVYGVSFLCALINAAAAVWILCLSGWRWRGSVAGPAVCLRAGLVAAIAVGLAWGYGAARLRTVDTLTAAAQGANVAVVQGNVPQQIKWDPAAKQATIARYLALSQEAAAGGAELVVWPETAAPFYFGHDGQATRDLLAGARQSGVFLLVGSPSVAFENGEAAYYNSAYLIDPRGQVRARYDKAHLVPFGEYVPLKRYLPFLGKIVAQVGDFRAGEKGRTMPWEPAVLGMLICYEIIFPDLAREMTANGAGILVNITNDAWYGRSSAPYQHFSMAVFRAVENRRSLVRSANTGISGFIDPGGRIVARTPLFVQQVLAETMPVLGERTLYTRFGDGFAILCLAATLAAAARRIYTASTKRRRPC